VEEMLEVKDHVIVVGEVEGIEAGGGGEGLGLAYADRGYRRVGEAMRKPSE
ncbi:flavin reductase, partial [Candidatus Bathyarchaeota archaeon]|nr:flavin reductase [Candidatus Bathyarchaeota archaeon]